MAGNTILVVDDEQRMRKLVRDFLTKQNFRVLEAADGEEAVDVFMENKDIVLVILDNNSIIRTKYIIERIEMVS